MDAGNLWKVTPPGSRVRDEERKSKREEKFSKTVIGLVLAMGN